MSVRARERTDATRSQINSPLSWRPRDCQQSDNYELRRILHGRSVDFNPTRKRKPLSMGCFGIETKLLVFSLLYLLGKSRPLFSE